MKLSEIKQPKKDEVVRDSQGRPLRGIAKERALRQKEIDKKFKDYSIEDDMIGNARVRRTVYEEELETKSIDDLWAENSGNVSKYKSVIQYQVREVEGSSPKKYQAFSLKGSSREPFGTFTSQELAGVLQPIRPNQAPDIEGFIVYVDPTASDAFQHSGDPVNAELAKGQKQVLKDGDYGVRVLDGTTFSYNIEKENDFEASFKKS